MSNPDYKKLYEAELAKGVDYRYRLSVYRDAVNKLQVDVDRLRDIAMRLNSNDLDVWAG